MVIKTISYQIEYKRGMYTMLVGGFEYEFYILF